jgi:hypothetical protein
MNMPYSSTWLPYSSPGFESGFSPAEGKLCWFLGRIAAWDGTALYCTAGLCVETEVPKLYKTLTYLDIPDWSMGP